MKQHPFRLGTMICAAAALAGCALEPARMALPAPLAAVTAYPFEGIGAGQKGQFRAGPYAVSFRRSDTRLALFDAIDERRTGKVEFSVSGPDFNGAVEAECEARMRTITLDIISFDPKPMAYQCRFLHEGRTLPARFEVQQSRRGVADMMMRQSRRGEIAFDRVTLGIASQHRLDGSPISTASPIGYVFTQDGVPVGAVELNGTPVLRFAYDSDASVRRAVVLAALALGILWDPADSALGRDDS